MNNLHIDTRLTVDNMNPRKESHGDERVLAIDLKLSGHVALATLVPLLGVESENEARGTLWDSEQADLTLLNVASMKFHDSSFDELCGSLGDVKFSEAKAHKFVLEPGAGGGELTFTLSIPHPEPAKVARFADAIGETHKVRIEPMQMDIEESATPDEAAATG